MSKKHFLGANGLSDNQIRTIDDPNEPAINKPKALCKLDSKIPIVKAEIFQLKAF